GLEDPGQGPTPGRADQQAHQQPAEGGAGAGRGHEVVEFEAVAHGTSGAAVAGASARGIGSANAPSMASEGEIHTAFRSRSANWASSVARSPTTTHRRGCAGPNQAW